jgi:hypothetical protein
MVILASILTSCVPTTSPPVSTKNPPIYPGAGNTQHKWVLESDVLEYDVQASPNDVFAFYKEELVKDGWVRPISQPTSGGVAFEWRQAGPNGPTHLAYRLTVVATEAPEGKTHVEVTYYQFDPLK